MGQKIRHRQKARAKLDPNEHKTPRNYVVKDTTNKTSMIKMRKHQVNNTHDDWED